MPTLSEDRRRVGAALHPAAMDAATVARLVEETAQLPPNRAGLRLTAEMAPHAVSLAAPAGPIGRIAEHHLGAAARPVRMVLFDKTERMNWALAWHQDRTILVKQRVEAPGFGPWSRKQGLLHVTPPADLLSRMVTLRLHLDPCDSDNAPLLVAEGSHRLGRVAEADIDSAVARHPLLTCLAGAGDVWTYATLILHASDRALRPRRRRVLQIDYAAEDLPGGLEWAGL